MIEVHKTDTDDAEFLKLVENLANDLVTRHVTHGLHLVHIDNWFDHKWLYFSGTRMGAVGFWQDGENLSVPAFTPKRVLCHQHWARDNDSPVLREELSPEPLHLKIPGADNIKRRVSTVAPSAALVWYTSNTKANGKGAIMAYVPNGVGYDTWYVGLALDATWRIEKAKGIAKEAFAAMSADRARS